MGNLIALFTYDNGSSVAVSSRNQSPRVSSLIPTLLNVSRAPSYTSDGQPRPYRTTASYNTTPSSCSLAAPAHSSPAASPPTLPGPSPRPPLALSLPWRRPCPPVAVTTRRFSTTTPSPAMSDPWTRRTLTSALALLAPRPAAML